MPVKHSSSDRIFTMSTTTALRFLAAVALLSSASALTKIWQSPATSSTPEEPSSSAAWQPIGARTPCARRTFVYQPDGHIESVGPLSATPHAPVERIVLPSTGVILLDAQTAIRFGDDDAAAGHSGACTARTTWRDYTQQTPTGHATAAWFDPAAWRIDAEPTTANNAARVHVDRVPCACDAVRLAGTNRTAGLQLGIRLRDGDAELRVGDVQLNGQSGGILRLLAGRFAGVMFEAPVYKSLRSFAGMAKKQTWLKSFWSNDVDEDDSSGCRNRQACECHDADNYESVRDAVCGNVVCSAEAACLQPIRVEGACCPVCGAVFETLRHAHSAEEHCPDVGRFRDEVQRLMRRLDDGRWQELVDFEMSVVATLIDDAATGGQRTRRQGKMVLADRGGVYQGYSAEFAALLWQQDTIRSELENAKFLLSFFLIIRSIAVVALPVMFGAPQIAGPAHRPGTVSPLGSLLVGTLLLVLAAYGVLYAHYERRWLDQPIAYSARLMQRLVGATSSANTRFRRFDNVSLAGGLAAEQSSAQHQAAATATNQSITTAAGHEVALMEAVGAVRLSTIAADSPTTSTAFDNPLFRGSSGGGGTTTAAAAGSRVEVLPVDGPMVLNDGARNDGQVAEKGIECENLIEVDLDSTETTNIF